MIYIPILAVAFAALNRVRGSRLDQLGIPIKGNGAFIAGIGMAAMAWWFTHNWIAALVVGAAYMLGEAPGWTRWLQGCSCNFTQAEWNEKPYGSDDTTLGDLANKLVDNRKNYKLHCFLGFMLRGLLWWVPVFAALWWFGMVDPLWAVGSVVGLSVAIPFVYYIGYKVQFMGKYLQSAEVLYGALYGATLGFVIPTGLAS
jgi:hypothetical protein